MRWVGMGSLFSLIVTAPAWAGSPPSDAATRLRAAYPHLLLRQENSQVVRIFGVPFGSGGDAQAVTDSFIQNHSAVFGVPAANLVPGNPDGVTSQGLGYQSDGSYRFTLWSYSQFRDGLPVFRAGLQLLTLNRPDHALTWAGANLYPLGDFHVPANGFDNVNYVAAQAAAAAAVPGAANFGPYEPVIWAGVNQRPDARGPRAAIVFEADNEGSGAPFLVRHLFVADALSGELVYDEDEVLHTDITGSADARATPNLPPKAAECLATQVFGLPYLKITTNAGGSTFADPNGDFTIANSGSNPVDVTASLATGGRWFKVTGGAAFTLPGVVPPGPAQFLFNPDDLETLRAQVNGYIEANRVRDYVLRYDPNYPGIINQGVFPINVNLTTGTCNAFYSNSTINFYFSGGGCNNLAYSCVVHHEYGHNVVAKGHSGQGEYGEGMGDCIALLISDASVMGYGFYANNCGTGIRNADNNCQYSAAACSSCGSEVHDCGMLLSGCVWSLRNQLRATNPQSYRDILSFLTINSILLHGQVSTINADVGVDFLTLDDNDGNIYNGTPHSPEIIAAFGAHGIHIPPTPPTLAVDPLDDYNPHGFPGGPYMPSGINYNVANTGDEALQYQVSVDQPWVTLGNTAGPLQPGWSVPITVNLNENVNAFAPGTYAAVITFTNTTNHIGDTTRTVHLNIEPVLLGDVNCDGHVDFGDIQPFVVALSGANQYLARYPNCDIRTADINGDGVVDFNDINPFVALLSAGGAAD